MKFLTWLIFAAAAILEVGGDAVIRKGMRGGGVLLMAGGATMLAAYGIIVNTVKWDFSRLLGVYVTVFATLSVLFGWIFFKEQIPKATWLGLAFIIAGGLIIEWGTPVASHSSSARPAETAVSDSGK